MGNGEYLDYMSHVLNEGVCFKPKSFRFTTLKKSIPIDEMIENISDYVEPIGEKINQNELKVFVDFIKGLGKDEWRKMVAFNDQEIIPIIK